MILEKFRLIEENDAGLFLENKCTKPLARRNRLIDAASLEEGRYSKKYSSESIIERLPDLLIKTAN